MDDFVPPSRQALAEALSLSDDILRNVELSELPLSAIALKASRLARVLNEFEYQKAFEFEAGGYPSTPNGMPVDVWKIATLADRIFQEKDVKTEEIGNYAYLESIAQLEESIRVGESSLDAARDPNI